MHGKKHTSIFIIIGIIIFIIPSLNQVHGINGDEIIGLTNDNNIFKLHGTTGLITIVDDIKSDNNNNNLTLGISCAKGENVFSFLSRTTTGETVQLQSFNLLTKTKFVNNMPFYPQATSEEFLLGLDYYMDTTSTTNKNLSIVGPDEIQFIHMVEVEIKENKKIAYNDILQYGGGLRLARGLSTFDLKQNQQWLQVVYDVSNNNSNTNNNSSQRHLEDVDPKIYFKRYDLNTASVLDIIPDIGNSAIFEYDIVTNNIFTIGWCTKKSKESSPQRCMFKIDNITKNSKSSILTSPKLESIFELPQYYDLIMSGVSSIDSSNNILYFVVSKKPSNNLKLKKRSSSSSFVTCNGGESGICKRYGDATSMGDNDDNFVVVGMNYLNGKIISEEKLKWEQQEEDDNEKKASLLTCGK